MPTSAVGTFSVARRSTSVELSAGAWRWPSRGAVALCELGALTWVDGGSGSLDPRA